MVVRAEEAPRTTVAYGIGYAEQDCCAAAWRSRGATSSAWTAASPPSPASASAAAGCSATFREPYLFGRRQELFVTAFREEEDRDAFDFVRYGVTLQTARTLVPRWSLILR